MEAIKMFTSFEISPVVEVPGGTVETRPSIKEAKRYARETEGRMFWSLYGCLPDGTHECIADRDAFDTTAHLYMRLTGLKAPQEPGQYLKLPGIPETESSQLTVMRNLLTEADLVLAKADEMIEEAIQLHVYGEDDDIPPDCNFTACLNQIRHVRELLK